MACQMGTVFLSNRGSRQLRTLGFLLFFDICSICTCVPVYVHVCVSSHMCGGQSSMLGVFLQYATVSLLLLRRCLSPSLE